MFFYDLLKRFLDLVYPPHCAVCRVPVGRQEYICKKCLVEFRKVSDSAHCSYCSYPFLALEPGNNPDDCFNCRDAKFVFAKNHSLFLFEGKVKEMIHQYKYRGADFLHKFMVPYLVSLFHDTLAGAIDIITFVPLDSKRYRQRGYNQSELLAKELAKNLDNIAFLPLLKQVKAKSVQSSLPRQERLANVKGVFGARKGFSVENARILLIDDVCTTGATLNECSKVLLAKGAKEVITLSFARAVLD